MPHTIHLVRHGETDYNKERRMQGWIDIPLNQTGHQQAHESSAQLQDTQVDAIYSSDLRRAVETAQHFASAVGAEIKKTKELRERDMGIFAGWAWEREQDPEKDKLWQEFTRARDQEDLEWNKHQGESIGDMNKRIDALFRKLHLDHREQTVMLVTHGGTINRILEYYSLKSASEGFVSIKNASVLTLSKIDKGKYAILK